ncbi:hypothetical protein MA16_Dca017384 [Dendrobium catenatum]|uniref:Uncharacterized protein n=1 Tax=Dendrobium catenatum TaxID=906689 RepID=A0A2I0VRN4_9ASPA|nr:hypothetical protein MA16_Dca017384 [Dendrobium catenatum]
MATRAGGMVVGFRRIQLGKDKVNPVVELEEGLDGVAFFAGKLTGEVAGAAALRLACVRPLPSRSSRFRPHGSNEGPNRIRSLKALVV